MKVKIFALLLLFTLSWACTIDENCPNGKLCNNSGECQNKSMFPLDSLDVVCAIVIFFASICSSISGIGGGVLFVSFIIITVNLKSNDAGPISQVTIIFVMGLRFIWELFTKEVREKGSNIHFDLAALFSPAIFMGTKLGVILNRVLPSWIILAFLIFLILFTILKTSKKGIQVYYKEKEENRIADNIVSAPSNHTKQESINDVGNEENNQSSVSQLLNKVGEEFDYNLIGDLARFQNIEKQSIEYKKVLFVLVGIAIVVFVSIFIGKRKEDSIIGVVPCSVTWWSFTLLIIPLNCLLGLGIAMYLNKEYEAKKSVGFVTRKGDIEWNKENLKKIFTIGICVGALASLLGIGGGLLLGPIFLFLGLHPSISSSTSTFCTLYTSIASVIQFQIDGKILWDYALLCGISGLFGSLIGMSVFLDYFKRKRKQSFIVLFLCIALVIALILNIYLGITNIIRHSEKGHIFRFSSVC